MQDSASAVVERPITTLPEIRPHAERWLDVVDRLAAYAWDAGKFGDANSVEMLQITAERLAEREWAWTHDDDESPLEQAVLRLAEAKRVLRAAVIRWREASDADKAKEWRAVESACRILSKRRRPNTKIEEV